jgi:hypothetical protein
MLPFCNLLPTKEIPRAFQLLSREAAIEVRMGACFYDRTFEQPLIKLGRSEKDSGKTAKAARAVESFSKEKFVGELPPGRHVGKRGLTHSESAN